jgi:hypothetical protein
MLTLFTFGYWGWGSATPELIRAIDAAERKKGFSPPVFVDIRLKRSVRAEGFRDDAFERLLPKGRYQWFSSLGNIKIGTKEGGIKIKEPHSARFLFEEALKYGKENRRIIFFCACEIPRFCHRHVVANLLLKEAKRTGRQIRISEWPGGKPTRTSVRVTEAIYKGICGKILNVRLSSQTLPRDLVGLPWGSIVDVVSGKGKIPIISGPARFHNGWTLPRLDKPGANTSDAQLLRASEKWLKSNGIRCVGSNKGSSPR